MQTSEALGKHTRSYTVGFKLQVIKYAEGHGNHAAGRKFDVHSVCAAGVYKRKTSARPPKPERLFMGSNASFQNLNRTLSFTLALPEATAT